MSATICGSRRSVTAIQGNDFHVEGPTASDYPQSLVPGLRGSRVQGGMVLNRGASPQSRRRAGAPNRSGPNEGKERVNEPAAASHVPASLNLLTPLRVH